ncbi:hypothetical protein L202_00868 [Cryptococcus amylolentus CBS 6039]|uniref:Uncharacterized protein n=1 Tax=Cryptococcus amylolentus CBS 6039 TaxID=1295533 RepID=A0A1E3I974_9TREE|nr:hypothetical protein L202_00868 [Cryptococcus amylolentus CBS 6039]ODN85038.1 hypothetical protein L202_00868 [Cryptococcus amylolentus CBS 6039]
MSSITPADFAALHPVHHLILDQLIASAPHSALRLCPAIYQRAIPVLYREIHSSPAVFRGVELQEGYERTVKALAHTKTIIVGGFDSIDTLYALAGPRPVESSDSSSTPPSSPVAACPCYPRRYCGLFPNLDRLEFTSLALGSEYMAYLDELDDPDPRGHDPLSWQRLGFQLPNDVREMIFYLDNDSEKHWYEVDQHIMIQRPHKVVIFIGGTVKTAAQVAKSEETFARLGEELPVMWYNAERLTVFVDTNEGLDPSDHEQVRRHAIPMGKALSTFAHLFARIVVLRQKKWALRDEGDVKRKLVDHVEIHIPLVARVLEEMSEEGRKQVDQLVRNGRLAVGEFEKSMVNGVDLMER